MVKSMSKMIELPKECCGNCKFKFNGGLEHYDLRPGVSKFRRVFMCELYDREIELEKVCDDFKIKKFPPNYRDAN